MKHHAYFMEQALAQAYIAKSEQEVPIGAIVVDAKENIIGRGYNQVIQQNSQHAHAEVLAIQEAGNNIGDWRLNQCVLYVTLQPCNMCFSLLILSRCQTLVFGAESPLFGFQLDNNKFHSVYTKNMPTIVSGIKKQESIELLQAFFLQRRKKG